MLPWQVRSRCAFSTLSSSFQLDVEKRRVLKNGGVQMNRAWGLVRWVGETAPKQGHPQ